MEPSPGPAQGVQTKPNVVPNKNPLTLPPDIWRVILERSTKPRPRATNHSKGVGQSIRRPKTRRIGIAIAIPILLVFGLLMLWPTPFEWLVARGRGLVDRSKMTRQTPGGNVSGFLLGTTLGLVWTPCAGPGLGSILTIIATSPHIKREASRPVAYAIGAAVPMLAIAYGGQLVTTRVKSVARVSHRLQQGFGVLVILFAVAMYFQYDTLITAWVSAFYP